MERIPEPELMLDPGQVRAYAHADFDEPHDRFIGLLVEKLAELPAQGVALDLGCGAGDISRRFARAQPGWRLDGLDGSPAMLAIAREMTIDAGLDAHIEYHEVRLPATPLAGDGYELIFSNSLLHHLADPGVFWSTIRDWSEALGAVFVMDLLRPPSREMAADLVQRYAGSEPEILRTDFHNSLLAAFEIGEVEAQLEQADLEHLQVEVVSDRHFIVWGAAGA
jgi:cyclopropane fatty-acyl-phospholipid synthase-like methyltransferase